MPGLMERLFGRGLMATPVTAMDTIATNPVGWSSMTPPQFASNASPFFNPMLEPGDMTRNQRIGAMLTSGSRDRPPLATDLPELTEAGDRFFDNAMAVAGATQPVGIRAFHGSPHTFDRFDMRKIGTGEGAQAYGHGLYFAGNEGVARGYRDALAPNAPTQRMIRLEDEMLAEAKRRGIPIKFQEGWGDMSPIYPKSYLAEWKGKIDALRKEIASPPPGSMYEVSLRTSPDRLLDWDKPLSQQPAAVREALPASFRGDESAAGPIGRAFRNELFGGDLIGAPRATPAEVAQGLANKGIDGIQFLDAGSRAAGDGTRNYVMFRDDLIDILRRYGLLGLLGGGAAAGAAEQ